MDKNVSDNQVIRYCLIALIVIVALIAIVVIMMLDFSGTDNTELAVQNTVTNEVENKVKRKIVFENKGSQNTNTADETSQDLQTDFEMQQFIASMNGSAGSSEAIRPVAFVSEREIKIIYSEYDATLYVKFDENDYCEKAYGEIKYTTQSEAQAVLSMLNTEGIEDKVYVDGNAIIMDFTTEKAKTLTRQEMVENAASSWKIVYE